MREQRPQVNKKIFIIVCGVTLACLVFASVLALWSTRTIQKIVIDQFNEEQLVVCRNIARSVRRGLTQIEHELLLLSGEIAAGPFTDRWPLDSIRRSLARLRANAVWKLDLVDIRNGGKISCVTSFSTGLTGSEARCEVWDAGGTPPLDNDLPLPVERMIPQTVWTSTPRAIPDGMELLLAVSIEGTSHRVLCAHLNLFQFLKPLLKGIRSGESGYAWMIDEKGVFLYHHDAYFVGRNAFEVRKVRDPSVDYRQINFIQATKMLKGEEGIGWYYSGWHREKHGKLRKLIAYTPVIVSDNPPQKWSVAVCAPFAEIEKAFLVGERRLLLTEGFLFVVIILGAAAVLFFEIRWSRMLEEKVFRRTEELRKSEEKYRSLVESAEDFIFTLDSAGHFQSMNTFTASFFGAHASDFLGKPISALFGKEAAARELKLVKLVFRSGKSVRDEFVIRSGRQETILDANYMPLRNEVGQVASVLCILRDITENKRLEKQLINAEKLASIGTLAAGVAHEINNPLGVILGFCDLLLEKTDPNTKEYQDLKMIEKQALLCKQVVENLLSFARQEKGELIQCDLTCCLQEIIQIVRHTLEMNGIELHLDLAENVPLVKGDSRQLQQVFLNLINNAVAAMKTGGDMYIRSKWDGSSGKVIVEIEDTGEGIDDRVMDRIFEPFFTTKPEGEGTGLGLFVSYGIVTKYSGSIHCTSRTVDSSDASHGTTFIVKLPAAEVENARKNPDS